MATAPVPTTRELLLTRRGLVYLHSTTGTGAPEAMLRAVELELGAIGYVLSTRLRARLSASSLDELSAFLTWSVAALLAHKGGDQDHTPLFRRFPKGIPADTTELWWKKVLVHFLQAEQQPCLFCCRVGTTHVLSPCQHVVCERCFDGASYSACPVCEHHVDKGSPFFREAPLRGSPEEKVRFALLDLGGRYEDDARALFQSLCERKQALSPADRGALSTLVREQRGQILAWLPEQIPVRENVALVFGTLFQVGDPDEALPVARRYLKTATDVLRFIAVLSGADGSLQSEIMFKSFQRRDRHTRFWGKISELLGSARPTSHTRLVTLPIKVKRFKVAKMSRPLRRALLNLLEGMDGERLIEDMLRHRSYWVWVGKFLHPHEHAERCPKVARAFQILRKKAPDGTPAQVFRGWHSRLEAGLAARDVPAVTALLAERPGELARRFDHALRLAGSDSAAQAIVIDNFNEKLSAFSTPVLLTLHAHLRTRAQKVGVRVYWPKGKTAKGVSAPDTRAVLPASLIGACLDRIDAELLARFAQKPSFADAILDDSLKSVMVPFNERTASASAVVLPRGSRVPAPDGKWIRLFLHWCQPEKGGRASDLDLSVGLYDASWQYRGVCSFYQLEHRSAGGELIARSAGDLRDAPWPDGATELVDLDRDAARRDGARFAVMVVNNYSGMAFSQLERGFAGLMARDDDMGKYFDPRTVEHKFAVVGENGVFLPLVFDLERSSLHWLDVQARGQFDFNTAASSSKDIRKLCPELISYFESGARANMFELAALHAAARCQRVFVRGTSARLFQRAAGESAPAFFQRIQRDQADEPRAQLPSPDGPAQFAALLYGDLSLAKGSQIYALDRRQLIPTLAASDLLI